MKRNRCVKILATLGPASSDQEQILKLFQAGADVFRINMSHTSHDRLGHLVKAIRFVELKVRRPIGILVDLQGPKLRLGTFENEKIEVREDDRIVLDASPEPGNSHRIPVPHPEIIDALEPGHTLLIDDGKVRLVIEEVSPHKAVARVVVGGVLSNRKGISVPDTTLAVSALTDKDRADLQAALEQDVDWIALSFVQRPEDILEIKHIVGGQAGVLAKIEKPQALQKLDEIVQCADAVMVARGDLGVEIPLQKVPGIQKQIIGACRALGKPVVVATQMLESMISHPVPTRAEVSDVATAILEGADAIMLSAESAAGKYPVQAVTTMNLIAEEIEQDPSYYSLSIHNERAARQKNEADAVAAAAREIADTMEMGAIACWTSSGATALRIARERPATEILALSPSKATSRRLTLVWGVHCVVTEDARDLDDMVRRACDFARIEEFSGHGGKILAVAGIPLGTPGATNMLRIATA